MNFDYEVRSAKDAFDDVPEMKIKSEMLDLAEHIINTKQGTFDASEFDDRYEAALTELVKAKIEGKAIAKRKAPKVTKVTDLMNALRQSAGMDGDKARPKQAANKIGSTRRKAPKSRTGASSHQRRKAG